MVRAKFRISKISKVNCWTEKGEVVGNEIEMKPVTGKEGENKIFGDATPTGEIKMTVIPELKEFEMNKEYYVDFKKAE